MSDLNPPSQHPSVTPALSKNQQKRIAQIEKRRQQHAERKQQQKEQKQLLKEQRRAELSQMPDEERQRVLDEYKASRLLQSMENEMRKMRLSKCIEDHSLPLVILDCGFSSLMSDKELFYSCQQLEMIYGVNSSSEHTLPLCFSSFNGQFLEAMDRYRPTHVNWKVFKSSEPFNSESARCHRQKVVYLTADSPNVLTDIEKNTGYVVGVIVDRNRLSGTTLEVAGSSAVETARLPLQEHCVLASSAVLSTVHVVDIIRLKYSGLDWKSTLQQCLPARKVSNWL
ncbi:hypothetical protein RCL1_003121 [Eukaryota sp. TZLM3-RCL]